ncbi:MAG TPA: SRPBCC family protein, partial [Polyangiaceae bacterium]|nr:SRPBCC family protein [Polyangiaceae bacterium]
APVEELFGFLTRFENLPRFMSHLREVRSLGERRWRWVAEGPLGAPVEWDAIVTDLIDGRLIGWRSAPGSVVQNGGRVRFIPSEDGGTRLEIELFYRPPGGLLGRIVAALAGADPKRALDEDLVRLKSLFEQGKTRVHGERVTREQLLRGEPGKPRDPLVH